MVSNPAQEASVTDVVYHALRRDLARGRYRPGTLRIPALVERFAVSPTPIREALRRLEAEGLVTLRERRVTVNGLSLDALGEIFAVRLELETFAMTEAARRRLDADLHVQLRALIEDMNRRRPLDPDGWHDAAQEFLDHIFQRAENRRLVALIDSLRVSVEPYVRRYARTDVALALGQTVHRDLFCALQVGDGMRAVSLLRGYLQSTEQTVQQGLASDADRRWPEPGVH
jgi:DNA-binding GntR family transcriptional regulator